MYWAALGQSLVAGVVALATNDGVSRNLRVDCKNTVVGHVAPSASYATRGVIKSFGPGRAFVFIAHEDIPGYMKAMTMTFSAKSKDQLADFRVGDVVRLQFTEDADGRRLIDTIVRDSA